jgi:hypothetical protein
MYKLAIKSNALEVMVKLVDVIAFSSVFKSKVFFHVSKVFQIGKNCNNTSSWKCEA